MMKKFKVKDWEASDVVAAYPFGGGESMGYTHSAIPGIWLTLYEQVPGELHDTYDAYVEQAMSILPEGNVMDLTDVEEAPIGRYIQTGEKSMTAVATVMGQNGKFYKVRMSAKDCPLSEMEGYEESWVTLCGAMSMMFLEEVRVQSGKKGFWSWLTS